MGWIIYLADESADRKTVRYPKIIHTQIKSRKYYKLCIKSFEFTTSIYGTNTIYYIYNSMEGMAFGVTHE